MTWLKKAPWKTQECAFLLHKEYITIINKQCINNKYNTENSSWVTATLRQWLWNKWTLWGSTYSKQLVICRLWGHNLVTKLRRVSIWSWYHNLCTQQTFRNSWKVVWIFNVTCFEWVKWAQASTHNHSLNLETLHQNQDSYFCCQHHISYKNSIFIIHHYEN